MSAWGVRPFQNDDSLDYRDDLIESLSKDIDSSLKSKNFLIDDLFALHGRLDVLRAVVKECGNIWLEKPLIESWIVRVAELVPPESNQMLADLKQAVAATLAGIVALVDSDQEPKSGFVRTQASAGQPDASAHFSPGEDCASAAVGQGTSIHVDFPIENTRLDAAAGLDPMNVDFFAGNRCVVTISGARDGKQHDGEYALQSNDDTTWTLQIYTDSKLRFLYRLKLLEVANAEAVSAGAVVIEAEGSVTFEDGMVDTELLFQFVKRSPSQ